MVKSEDAPESGVFSHERRNLHGSTAGRKHSIRADSKEMRQIEVVVALRANLWEMMEKSEKSRYLA
jgi:hypothetical protein